MLLYVCTGLYVSLIVYVYYQMEEQLMDIILTLWFVHSITNNRST